MKDSENDDPHLRPAPQINADTFGGKENRTRPEVVQLEVSKRYHFVRLFLRIPEFGLEAFSFRTDDNVSHGWFQ